MKTQIPLKYRSELSIHETQIAIKVIKALFETSLSDYLNLSRVSAPLFLPVESGLNDNLSGRERPIRFDVPNLNRDFEIVHSLAKWKRTALKRYGFNVGEGLYTDMNAIRRDEELDSYHSLYVDQWDWEKIITSAERTEETLIQTAKQIFYIFKELESNIVKRFPKLSRHLPESLTIITAQELLDENPKLSAKDRELKICREHKAVFIMQIGDVMSNGESHGSRAPDYDDWMLNGDLMFYYPVLDCALEMSSMGIRVDTTALKSQMKKARIEKNLSLPYHQAVLNEEIPYTIGGGIGQSRTCMFLLGKAHIGEVQSSVWPEETVKECERQGISLL
jgi:aspartate--ammonia ligase